jgi:hypothetical protein
MTLDRKNSKFYGLEYKPENKAILLGNGLNNLTPSYRWDELLKKIDNTINLANKSYTLAFEEIVLNRVKSNPTNENYKKILRDIKKQIGEHCQDITPGEIHQQLNNIKNISTYLTTNYDYAIEKMFNKQFSPPSNRPKDKGYKYSLDRVHKVNGKDIWHIHGEINNGRKYATESIMLGHEHYGDTFRRMHQYLRPFSTDDKTKAEFKKKNYWVDVFFTHDLHIVGLALDLSEFHLWWLLAYRARLKINSPNEIKNKIFFHCASYDTHSEKDKAKIEVLQSFGVIIKEKAIQNTIEDKYEKYWTAFLNDINSIIENNE